MEQTSGQNPRLIRVPPVSGATYSDVVSGFLQREYGPLRNAAKIVARMCRVSPRTSENWFAGECAPQGDKLIDLMAANDALAEEIMKLVKARRDGNSDR